MSERDTHTNRTHDHRPKKKETWFLGEFEGRWATHRQGGEWGTDVWDGVRTGVSERVALTVPRQRRRGVYGHKCMQVS